MKHSIKIAMASLLVLGSLQANATEVDLDVTDMLTQTITSYISQTTIELENSIKDTLTFNTETMLNSWLSEPLITDIQAEIKTENTVKPVQ
ncbi:hypothetical protein PNIG_b0607 [Pseudoalteromonas nigrifaciens]|jgi:hypothetical protein|uniref:Orphan protein n=2 Tax=Pseudoalteromonas TaxID=53246 RepID=Q3IC95_PSET1|nr:MULTISPECIES: hypothetical protein [Pseudoalteromonas]ASM56165.1 hypothetical protein PNIG_b0607 [Pseudoalteromonas nigrifaciens]MBB1404993.1 hypothetical protein [Pseudoalteromonas sp. SG44-5]MBH0072130.1 hypothetical protein [Pseudoalteromonas sp. NZS127]WMS96451.1 hypothetical protein RB215_15975 [Pseudoalteromonas sp. HL-AS2]CAI89485.1 putative orphan protein [Pseudoalteromonas translucida]|tara:strand:- start:1281 stop:1553 length:273 start_codon:yes stop_codon:yes gene_type:complete